MILPFQTTCFGDWKKTRKLEARCNEVRKAVPSGLELLPIEWDSKDEANLKHNLQYKPLVALISVGVSAAFMTWLALVFNERYPEYVDNHVRIGFVLGMSGAVRGTIVAQVINILALQARKRDSVYIAK